MCRFSRHITHDLRRPAEEEKELQDGTLCYAAVERAGAGYAIKALYPVMISRKLYDLSPLDLMPPNLLPATTANELSPADRVFGWMNQAETKDGEQPARRSLVRLGPVTCENTDAVEAFAEVVLLAILGQPKPQQGKFYLGTAAGKQQPP